MLHFFRQWRYKLLRQTQNPSPSSPTTKYILYALGEIALVVIGILIALQVNTWTEENKQRKKEQLYLGEIRNNLEDDLYTLKYCIQFNTDKDAAINACINQILEAPTNGEVMTFLTQNMPILAEFKLFTQNRVAFENMLSAENIDLISGDSLRLVLSSYYSETNLLDGTQERVKEMTRMFVDHITPMLMNKENIRGFLGRESDFISGNDLNFKTNREIFGFLFGMQRNIESHTAYLEDYQREVEQILQLIEASQK